MATSTSSAPARPIRRVTHPTTFSVPAVPIIEIAPGTKFRLRILSPAVHSVWVHVSGRRPLPCFSDNWEECEHHRLPMQKQHWLYVKELDGTKVRMVRLTDGLVYREVPELVAEGCNLNGMAIELWRASDVKPDSAMLGNLLPDERQDIVTFDAPDLAWSVTRLLTAPSRLTPWQPRRSSARGSGSSAPASAAISQEERQTLRAILDEGRKVFGLPPREGTPGNDSKS